MPITTRSSRNPSRKVGIRKKYRFSVGVVPLGTYPDLDSESSNPYIAMSTEERLKNLIDVFGLIWAETCIDLASEKQ